MSTRATENRSTYQPKPKPKSKPKNMHRLYTKCHQISIRKQLLTTFLCSIYLQYLFDVVFLKEFSLQ